MMLAHELHDWIPALLGGLSALADAIVGVGIVVPGEVAVTGLATTVDGAQTGPFILLVATGASLGDHLNYGLGRVLGSRLAGSRLVAAIGVRHWHRGMRFVDRYGAWAIVLTRLIPLVRTVVPAIAGAGGMPYRRFLPASVTGSLLWTLTWVLAGHVVTHALTDVGVMVALMAVALAALVLVHGVRRWCARDR